MSADIRRLTATIEAITDLTPAIRQFDLAVTDRLPPYAPGSHIEVTVTIGGVPEARSYSLLPPPRPDVLRIAVKRLAPSRGGSAFMWGLGTGDRLAIAPPANRFALSPSAPDYLLIAGGIGITPLLGMARTLARTGRSFRFLYAGRSRTEMAYLDALHQIAGDRLAVFASDEGRRIDLAAAIAQLHPDGELYLCGPLRLLEGAREAWRDAGRAPHRLRTEVFGDSGLHAPETFEVVATQEGKSVRVAAGETMVAALARAGVEVMTDCLRGECGLCAVTVTACDGIIDHRDVFLSDAEKATNARLCACVSRVVGGSVAIDTGYRA